MQLLAGGGPDAGRTDRPDPPGRGPAAVRADAGLRQPRRAVRRADRTERRGPGQLPASLHPPGADQRRLQPRPGPRRPVGLITTPLKISVATLSLHLAQAPLQQALLAFV